MPRLNLLICVALLLPILSCSAAKPPQSQGWKEATGTEAYERLWWKAVQERDVPNIERHLAPIYTLATQAGIQDRQQALQHFRSMELTSIEMGELQVKPHGGELYRHAASQIFAGASALLHDHGVATGKKRLDRDYPQRSTGATRRQLT